ncbi:MAG TPA: SURF1 family protein [Candidatus Luteococcus avicola]|nr:SURF1 family protein [Candidatus Luteococcus avicola]
MSTGLKQLLLGLGGVLVACVFVFLGLWQMQVFRSQGQQSVDELASQPLVGLEQELASGTAAGELYGRTVGVSGEWLDDQVLVGEGYPARVVQAFRTEGGRTIAVARGTVTAGQKAADAPAGIQEVTGVLLPTQSSAPVGADLPAGSLGAVQLDVLAQEWPAPLFDAYLTQPAPASAAQGLGESPVIVPDQRGNVRNEGYALQWWSFALFGLVLTWVGVRRIGAGEKATDAAT